MKLFTTFIFLVAFAVSTTRQAEQPLSSPTFFNGDACASDHLFMTHFKPQVAAIAPDIKRIIEYVLSTEHAGETYELLATFVDKFGPRFTGTPNLEDAIDYMLDWLKREGHENVHGENVTVPKWHRNNEWATMVKPRRKALSILGLGYSVGTNNQTIQAPVIVVRDFDELERRSAEAKGKIVVFNFKFESYGKQAVYRGKGASRAAKHGAVAALIRSLTPLSINSPHTGGQMYDKNVTKIPAVSITVEDAELMQRIADRKEEIIIQLYSENYLEEKPGVSRNTISELVGTSKPKEIVIVSGHLDSWDVTQGAMDDGAGAFISWRALSIVKKLGLKPKRTLRSVLWTGEEMGLIGAAAYTKAHHAELQHLSLAMESDMGTFEPTGITFSGSNLTAQCTMHAIMQLLEPVNGATALSLETEGSDVMYLYADGAPVTSLANKNGQYFLYHHTAGDTMSVLNRTQIDQCQAVWTSVAYAVAALDDILPDDRKAKADFECC